MQVRKQVLCVQPVFYSRIHAFLFDGLNHCLFYILGKMQHFYLLLLTVIDMSRIDCVSK
jgi:hypothetical protein